MSEVDRDELRSSQDSFLNHHKTQQFISVYGKGWALFDSGRGPSADDLKNFIYPEYADRIRHLLTLWERKGRD